MRQMLYHAVLYEGLLAVSQYLPGATDLDPSDPQRLNFLSIHHRFVHTTRSKMADMQVLTNMKQNIEKMVSQIQDVQKGMYCCSLDISYLPLDIKGTVYFLSMQLTQVLYLRAQNYLLPSMVSTVCKVSCRRTNL